MLKKLRIDRKGTFELALATSRLAEMLVAYVEGRQHDLSIGREQGEIDEWDDIVVERPDRTFEHHQAKYKMVGDVRKNIVRGYKPLTKKRTTQELQDLSEIDKVMASLAERTKDEKPLNPRREFFLRLPSLNLAVKEGLFLYQLAELCDECKRTVTRAERLQDRASKDGTTQRLWQWLNSWCGFVDWHHIKRAMSLLHLVTDGSVEDLERKTNSCLATTFSDPEGVLKLLDSFVTDNTTDVGAITPRMALKHVTSYLRPEKGYWTQYQSPSKGRHWSVSGTHGPVDAEPTHAGALVPDMWRGSGALGRLMVDAHWPPVGASGVSMHLALGRLAVHLTGPKLMLAQPLGQWKERVAIAVGGTLGKDASPVCQNWQDYKPFDAPDCRELSCSQSRELEAASIHETMDGETLSVAAERVGSLIEDVSPGELKSLLEENFKNWEQAFRSDTEGLGQLLRGFLRPKAEGPEIDPSLRLGPQTADIVGEALFLLLVVATALGGRMASWKEADGVELRAIALRYWSGPSGLPKKVQRVDQKARELLAGENEGLIILSGVEASAVELFEDSLADDDQSKLTLAEQHLPQCVTNHRKIRMLIERGSKSDLDQLIRSERSRTTESVNAQIDFLAGNSGS